MIASLKRLYRERFEQLQIGDEVEFTVKVDIAMGPIGAWVKDPGGTTYMYGKFYKANEVITIRGNVSSLSSLIHVSYLKYLPGHEPERTAFGDTNIFVCHRTTLKKVLT